MGGTLRPISAPLTISRGCHDNLMHFEILGGISEVETFATGAGIHEVTRPFAAGGAVDTLARLVTSKMTETMGQPVLIENRPGAAGNVAAEAVAKSPPDGYTILQNTNGQVIAPALYSKLNFDPVKDFVPVTRIGPTPPWCWCRA